MGMGIGMPSNIGASYEITVSAERGQHPIYSGMNANVIIRVGEQKQALVIPSTALYQNNQ